MEATNTAELTMDEFVEYLETRSPRNTTGTPAVAQDADAIRIKPLDNCPIAYDEGAIIEATNIAELTMDEFVEYLETRSPRRRRSGLL